MHDSGFEDALGVVHRPLQHPAQARIVSLVPSITELLFELGLGPQLVGRTTFCVHPQPQVQSVPRMGGTKKVRLDRLLASSPTHVVVNIDENTRELADAITAAGVTLVVTHPCSPRDNLSLYRLLGGIFGRAEAAQRLCDDFEHAWRQLSEARKHIAAREVLYLIWRDPWMSVSADTYVARMLASIGWHQLAVASKDRYPAVSLPEEARGAELILLASEPFPFKPKHRTEIAALLARAGLEARIELIDGEMVSWYGYRAIAGLQYLARFGRAKAPFLAAHS